MNNDILGELHKLYRDDQLILFVGSGVSINSKVASWDDLTNKIVKLLDIEKKQKYTYFDHLLYAESLFNRDEVLYEQTLSDIFSMDGVNSSDLHKKIMDLNQSDIVTTNFDTLLEKSDSYVVPQYEVVNSDEQLLSATKKNKIIKMHGDVSDIESIVLKESDYINYENKKKAIHTYLKHLFFSKTIVFIGYSLSDYNIKQILNDINNYSVIMSGESSGIKHYFLTYKEQNDNYELVINNLKNKNIECIDVSEYEDDSIVTSLEGKGIAYYNFLCAIENYNMHKLPAKKMEKEILKRFQLLDQQVYVSTNDIISILEINESQYMTPSKLIIHDQAMYDILKEGNRIITNVFSKTLVEEVILMNGNDKLETFQIDEYDERYKQMLKQIRCSFSSRSKLNIFHICSTNNQIYDQIHDYFVFSEADSNSYIKIKNQTNHAILNTIRESIAGFDKKSVTKEFKMIEKIQFIENSLKYEEQQQFKELLKIAKFEYGILSYNISELFARIKKETSKTRGLSYCNVNYFDKLDNLLQSVYVYPTLNRSAVLLAQGNFRHVMEGCAEVYLSPFKKEYYNLITDYALDTNKMYGNHILEEWHIFAFSEMIRPRILREIIENANIEKIEANINTNDILNYIEEIWHDGLFKNDKLEFIKNVVTFLSYIDRQTAFKELIKLNIEIKILSELLPLFPIENITEYDVSATFCNELFNQLFDINFDLKSNINVLFFLELLDANVSLLSDDNLSILRTGISVKKNKKIPQNVFVNLYKNGLKDSK